MSAKHRFVILTCLLFSFKANASEFFLTPLYWRATEPINWLYINSMTIPNQLITIKTVNYNFAPGIRGGGILSLANNWQTQLYFTHYYTSVSDTATGNLKSAFLGAKVASPSADYFYQAGQINSAINYNILDWNFGKRFDFVNGFMIRPLFGLEGGWINQAFNSRFQGSTSVTEKISNNFYGIGPKVGIEGEFTFLRAQNYHASFIANFGTAYFLGHWQVTDTLNANPPKNVNINTNKKTLGVLSVEALVGLGFVYKNFAIKAGYEINDWFNQCQLFDNDTGSHNNDLILQGLNLRVVLQFLRIGRD